MEEGVQGCGSNRERGKEIRGRRRQINGKPRGARRKGKKRVHGGGGGEGGILREGNRTGQTEINN